MSINNSLLNDVEKLFIKFFEAYHHCGWYAYHSDYSLTDEFRELRYSFALHDDDGLITDAQLDAYFQWETDYLKTLGAFAKTKGYSISYKNYGRGQREIYVSYDFSISKEDLLKECLGNAAKFVEIYTSANRYDFLEFMVRYGASALNSDTLRELKATFTNAIDYLEEDVTPKAKKFRESFFEVREKVKGYDSEAWVSCAKTLKPLYYEEYQIAYAAYEKLLELNSNDEYARRISNFDHFHNFDEFYDDMVRDRNSESLISIQMIRQVCEKRIRELLEQQ